MTAGGSKDLVTGEGVDEGSAASTAEGSALDGLEAGAEGDLLGEPMHGAPRTEAEAAPPVDDGPDDLTGPGQQLAEGEG